jgi:hypothetical protein
VCENRKRLKFQDMIGGLTLRIVSKASTELVDQNEDSGRSWTNQLNLLQVRAVRCKGRH